MIETVGLGFQGYKTRRYKIKRDELKFENLGRLIAEYRTARGFTQVDVAQECGWRSPQFISNIERGIASPPLSALTIIMTVLSIPKSRMLSVMENDMEEQVKATIKRLRSDL